MLPSEKTAKWKHPASCIIVRVKPLLKTIKITDFGSTNYHTRVSLWISVVILTLVSLLETLRGTEILYTCQKENPIELFS